MSGILKLESLTKGNTLRQGDLTLLKYRLFDADGDKLDISGKPATVRLMKNNFTFIAYEKEGLTVAPDDTISFNINKILPAGIYHLEVLVDDKYIFPSRDDEGKLNVDKSSLGADVTIVEATGVEAVARKATGMMKQDEEFIDDMVINVIDSDLAKSITQGIDAKATSALNLSESADTLSKSVQEQFNQVVIDGDSSVESAQARVTADGVTKATLKERLDDEHTEVTTQLTHTENYLANTLSILNYVDYVVDGDWTPALGKAIDDLSNRGVIIIPSEITLKTPLVIEKDDVTIRGLTRNTNIRKDGNFVGITTLGAYVNLVDFKITGVVGNGGDGINMRGSRNSFTNIHSNNHGGHGIRLGKLTESSIDNVNFWRLENITAIGNGLDGVHIQQAEIGHDAPPDLTAGYFVGLDSRDNGGDGLFVGSSLNNTFIGIGAQHNGKLGIRAGLNSSGNHFYNPYVESNGEEVFVGMVLEEGSRQNIVIGERARLSYTTIEDNGAGNTILTHDSDLTGAPLTFKNGVYATKQVVSNSAVSGYWEMKQMDNRHLHWTLGNTSANSTVTLKHGSTGSVNFVVENGGLGVGSANLKDFINKIIKQAGTINYGSVAPNSQKEATMQVVGATEAHNVTVSLASFPMGISLNAYVSADNVVKIRVTNHTVDTINLGSVVTRVTAFG